MFTGNLPDKLQVPEGTPPEIIAAIENAARDTFIRHGVSAFQMSREAAIAHEPGHAIIGAHEGLIIQSVRIFSRSMPFGKVWGGWCAEDNDRGHRTGPDTSAESDLSIARVTIGGLAGEAVRRLDRDGSSLDELAVSQNLLGRNAAFKLADPALSDAEFEAYVQELWHERVWCVAVAILRENWEPFMRLAEHLDRHEKIKGSKLRNILAQVRRITS